MSFDRYQLSKSDYKVIRELLSVALERQFVQGLEQVAATIEEWRAEKPESAREYYHKVLSDLKDHRKMLARTYDTHNKFSMEMSVIVLLSNKILTETGFPERKADLKNYFLEEVKRRL